MGGSWVIPPVTSLTERSVALMTQPNYVVACFIIQELTETNFVSQSAVGHFSAPRLSNL